MTTRPLPRSPLARLRPLLSALLLSLLSANARAATQTVTNLNDSGAGSLRQAITSAAPGDTVTFQMGLSGTVTVASALPTISQGVSIMGPGASLVAVDGGGAFRVFAVSAGTVNISGLTIQNGHSAYGGGVSNAGTLTLTACTLSGNVGNFGGGVFNLDGGTLTLTACTLYANTAINAGGGVCSAGGAVTLTGCTLSANTARPGGGGVTVTSGTLTLTDDVLYGDTGGEGVQSGGSVAATDCDVQGGIDGNDAANHVLNVDPQFVSPTGPYDLHLQSDSPVIGQGTGALATDHDGRPYFTPPALGAYEGPRDASSDTHVLWTNPDGRTIFWDVNARGARLADGPYGPFQDDAVSPPYAAVSLSSGPDGASHLLWSSPDGNTYLWTVQADGTYTPFLYGLMEDDGTQNTIWKPVAVSTGGDSITHVLWSNPDGRTVLWDVQSDGSFTVVGNYDPQPGYTPAALASGADGLSHVLWNGAGGKALLWDLDAQNQPTAFTYGPFSDDGTSSTLWSARAISVGPDNVPHLLWTNPDGRTILWDVAADGGFTIPGTYGPFQDDASGSTGYAAVALATGADGLSHFAWDNGDGNTFLWSVNPDGSHADTYYPPFLDGPSASVWKAVAVSAAP